MPRCLTNFRLFALLAGSPSTKNSIGWVRPVALTLVLMVVELMILFGVLINMQITNKHGIPDTILRAIDKRNSEYNRGDVDRSVTQLIGSPRIDLLRKSHFGTIEIDASREFWPLLGSAVHKILEMGASEHTVIEERLYASLDGWSLSGAIDVQEYFEDGVDIYDYKVCTVFSVNQNDGEGKFEWEAQQNIYRWLVETVKGVPVRSVSIVAIIRDWQNSGPLRDPMYPPAPIVTIPLKMWTLQETEQYIRERINAHRMAEMVHAIGGEVAECTEEERWYRGDKFKIKRIGGKRASKICSTQNEADQYMATLPEGYEIEHEKGSNVRCENNFCQVAEHCSQFAKIKQQ